MTTENIQAHLGTDTGTRNRRFVWEVRQDIRVDTTKPKSKDEKKLTRTAISTLKKDYDALNHEDRNAVMPLIEQLALQILTNTQEEIAAILSSYIHILSSDSLRSFTTSLENYYIHFANDNSVNNNHHLFSKVFFTN